MIRSILLAVDASENAKVAMAYANFLGYKLEASLQAVYVSDTRIINAPYWTDVGAVSLPLTPFSNQMREVLESQGHSLMDEVTEKAKKAGVRVRTELRMGFPATEILAAAQGSDLIVLGRRGESSSLESQRGLGAVAERVVRGSTQPVLVASEEFQDIRRIFLGFDGSERARAAMTYAVELATRLTLPLLAVSVQQDEELAKERLETVSSYAQAHDLDVTTLALQGDPADAILAEVEEGDLIAMGAFGEGRVREWLLGSTTEAVLRAAEQPVLLHR